MGADLIMSIRQRLLTGELLPAMARLSPRHRDVIRLRFGLDDDVQRDYPEVAKLFGCQVEEIISLEQEALAILGLTGE